MSFIVNSLKTPKKRAEEETAKMQAYHYYADEVFMDGFISPIVLPHERLAELRGMDTLTEFSARCRLSIDELEFLLENPNAEPSPRQLVTLAMNCGVSVLWLLGYHTTKQKGFSSTDKQLLNLISRRNAAEHNARDKRYRGYAKGFFMNIVYTRIQKLNLAISQTAAMIVANEHCPLSEQDLLLLRGQPVFVEQADGESVWGLVMSDYIQTLNRKLFFEQNGEFYQSFLTPEGQKGGRL